MALIKGIWNFKEVVTLININQKVNYINFGFSSKEQTSIVIINQDSDKRILIQPTYINVYREPSGWSDVEYRVFNFGEVEQEVSDEFAMWVFENATGGRVSFPDSSNNIQVPIRDNGITVLATKGTYCETDIDINVQIEDKTEEAFEAGKKAEYDAFWDVVQEHGKRTDYNNVFVGYVFGTKNFYPKYNMKPTNANKMFYAWEGRSISSEDWETFSLSERLKECGVILDTSLATDIGSMFAYSRLKKIPTIDARLSNNSTNVFKNQWHYLETIEKLIVNENVKFDYWFVNSEIINISFEGVIGQNLDIGSTRLSKESIKNVIVCLSSTTIGKTLTLSQTAVNKAFETATGAANGSTSEEWLALTATKSNWTISLA